MNGLVVYSSSDEDEVEDAQPIEPIKISKQNPVREESVEDSQNEVPAAQTAQPMEPHLEPRPTNNLSTKTLGPAPGPSLSNHLSTEMLGPAPGPSFAQSDEGLEDDNPPLSPYSLRRQQIHELTMPTVPDFSIPDSPPLPPVDSEAAARLAVTTKKFNRFLELKKQGVHFNSKLEGSMSLRNPNLLPKLMQFAGISTEDSYASSLPEGLGVPVKWDDDCYVEALLKKNDRDERKRLAAREKIDFVPGSAQVAGPESQNRRKTEK